MSLATSSRTSRWNSPARKCALSRVITKIMCPDFHSGEQSHRGVATLKSAIELPKCNFNEISFRCTVGCIITRSFEYDRSVRSFFGDIQTFGYPVIIARLCWMSISFYTYVLKFSQAARSNNCSESRKLCTSYSERYNRPIHISE